MNDLPNADKLKTFNLISSRIDTIEKVSTEIFELIYKAAYNEAIEDSIRAFKADLDIDDILKLKKE